MPQTRATLCKFLKTNYYSYLFLVSFENAINWRSLQHCVHHHREVSFGLCHAIKATLWTAGQQWHWVYSWIRAALILLLLSYPFLSDVHATGALLAPILQVPLVLGKTQTKAPDQRQMTTARQSPCQTIACCLHIPLHSSTQKVLFFFLYFLVFFNTKHCTNVDRLDSVYLIFICSTIIHLTIWKWKQLITNYVYLRGTGAVKKDGQMVGLNKHRIFIQKTTVHVQCDPINQKSK